MMWNVCFCCGEPIVAGNDSYHIVSGYVSQMNHEMDTNLLYSSDGEVIQTRGGIRTTLEFVSYGTPNSQHIIKSFHRECWLATAGKEFL